MKWFSRHVGPLFIENIPSSLYLRVLLFGRRFGVRWVRFKVTPWFRIDWTKEFKGMILGRLRFFTD